jgi:ABC-type antimicrobial peptide transport system permease subunit
LAITGIAIGLAAGFLLTRLMASVLYKTSAHDLRTFAAAPLAFLLIAWLASYLPARRATRVDPLDSLRLDKPEIPVVSSENDHVRKPLILTCRE